MNKKIVNRILTVSGTIFAIFFINSCAGWMEDDGFFDAVEQEVFVANAEEVDVFVRCANSGWGLTVPSGYSVVKQNVSSSISATPGSGYGFWKWAAFSTSDFNPGRQNNSFIYTSVKEYEDNLSVKELSLNDVSFANSKEASTTVTVKTTRNDIAIVPVFVRLATLQSCTPSNGASGVAVNSTVRLTFSRDISANNIGEYITILQGTASPVDITENFDITVSGKTITCKFKTDSELTNFRANQRITLEYSEDIRDTEGYPIAESGSLKFSVGDANNIDNTAPKITEIKYSHPTSSDVKFDKFYDESEAAGIIGKTPAQIKSTESTFFNRRIKDILSISVVGGDFVGNATLKNPSFNDSASIGNIAIKAQTVVSSTGEKLTNGTSKSFEYEYFEGSYEDINLGELDDGLIRLQIGLVDNSGNSSLDKTGYYSQYDNGYKTIFVVKDTSAPDAAANSNKVKVASQDFLWFNASSISDLKFLNDTTVDDGISDIGNEYFRSKSENIKWIFHAGKAASWTKPSANDSGWKSINEGYAFGSQLSDLVQGSNPVCVAFMDDVGNISEITEIATPVMYDDVKPVVGDDVKWVRNDNSEDGLVLGITGQKVVSNQSLYVPINDATSGIQEMVFVVSNNGTQRADSLSSDDLKIFYITTELEAGKDYTVSGNTLKFTVPKEKGSVKVQGLKIDDDSASGDAVYKIKVNIVDAAGNISVDIADDPQISCDSVKPAISKVVIPPVVVDGVKVPVIESIVPYGSDGTGTAPVYFAGIQSGLDYGSGKNAFTLDLYITEQTSGVQQITFEDGCNVRLSSESTLSVIHSGSTKDLVKNTDYTVDGTGKIITFLDSVNPLVKDENAEFVLSITKCTFENVKYKDHETESDENSFSFTLKDFAQLSSDSSVTTVKASENGTEDIATVVANALPAKIESVKLEDRSSYDDNGNVTGSGDGPYDLRKSENGFTNYEIINVIVDSPTADDANKNCSVRKITLTGAKFVTTGYAGNVSNNTGVGVVVNGSSHSLTAGGDYKISDDGKSIEFTRAYDIQTAFQFFNVLLDTTDDGEKTVSATAYSPAGVSYSAMSTKDKKITLDKTPPALADEGPFAYDYQNNEGFRSYEYPRQKNDTDYETYGLKASDLGLATYGSMAGNAGSEIRFFYTSKAYRRLPIKVEDTNSISSINERYLQIKVVNSIKAGEATSQGVLGATGYAYSTNRVVDFSTNRLGTAGDVGYYYYGSKNWSSTLKPYTYVAADKAGNVSEPHQFYVIKDDKSPSITVDGTDYGTATDAVRKSKSLTNLMELVIPDGKRVFRNTVENTASGIYDASEFNFWNDKDGHETTSLSSYQYVLPEGEFKIRINLKSGVASGTMLIGGVSGSDVSSYSQRIPTPGDSGLAKWAITHYYKKWNSTATESNWDAAWPVGTLGAAFFDSRVTWNDYDGGDIVYTIPDSSKGVPPLTLLLMDNCANIYQIPIRPASMDAPMTEYTLDSVKFPCHSGESVSWIFDKKLPEPILWSSGIEDTLDNQFIIFAGGCDDNQFKNISGDAESREGNTYGAVGCDRLGALYRDTVNNIQYYNHKVYLQLLVNSNEPVCWNENESRRNNVQILYDNDSTSTESKEFTLRARILFRQGTGTAAPSESDFAGMSNASLTKWSCFKRKSGDVGNRIWNILMPHGDEGALGTLWLYMEDYVGNKCIHQIKNGSDVDKFAWNDEPPKVKLRTDAAYPTAFDTAKTSANASKFSNFGTYRHYSHLAFTSAADIKRLVPPTIFKKKYIKTQTSNMSDTRYSVIIDKAEEDRLVMNDVYVIGDVTYVGDTAYNLSGGDYAREEVGNNTYAVNPVLCFFDIDVSDSPSGIDGYRYCFAENEGDDNRQNDWEGNKSNGYWYINHTGEKNDSKRVNAQVPVNLSYIKDAATEYNQRTFNLYIRDRVGNVSVTKLGNQWMMDNSYPATVNGSTWTGGKANPGNSYLSLPGADSRKQINVTIAGSSEAFKTATENGNPYSIKIPADWFNDFQKRTNDGSGTGTSSGVYGAGLIPNVMGSAKPVSDDGYLTVDIPYFVYKDADATTAQTLEYYIFDKTGNYWTCNLKVKVDASAPTMRVGVTRYGDNYTFHSEDNLYTKVFGTGALPKDIAPDTTTTAEERISYQGNALNTFSESEGYSNERYEKLYSLASNVSKQYSSKADVDYAYLHGTEDERSRFFKIRSNNAAFFVNVWAVDDGGISQVSIRKWGNNEWVDQTDQGKIVFTNENQNVKQMLFEKIPDVVSLENNGKEISKEGASSIRNSIYVSTAGQSVENLYEVSATDFAGNAVFYYAYILPFDNAVPSVTDVTVAGNPGSSVVGDNFYFNTLNFSLKATDAGAGLGAYWISAKQKSKYKKFDGNISNTAVDSTLFEEGCKEFWVYVQDVLGNEKTVENFTVSGVNKTISNFSFVYDKTAPSITGINTVKRTGTTYVDSPVTGTATTHSEEDAIDSTYVEVDEENNTILIKNRNYPSTLKVSMKTAAAGTDDVRGYIVTDGNTKPSFDASLIVDEITIVTDTDLTTDGISKYIWAVDHAGNISDSYSLNIKYKENSVPVVTGGEVKIDDAAKAYVDGNYFYYGKDGASFETKVTPKAGDTIVAYEIVNASAAPKYYVSKPITDSSVTEIDGGYKIKLPEVSGISGGLYVRFRTSSHNYSVPCKLVYENNGTMNYVFDDVAPSCTTTNAEIRNGSNYTATYYSAGNINAVDGSWYELKDNGVGNDYTTRLYTSGTKVSLKVSDANSNSKSYSYAFTYGSYDDIVNSLIKDSNQNAPETWSDYTEADNTGWLTVILPEVETVMHGYLMIWLKDRVGNISCPYNMSYPTKTNENWLGMYKAPSAASWYQNGNVLNIYDYDAGSGLKAIKIEYEGSSPNISSVTLGAVNSQNDPYNASMTTSANGSNTYIVNFSKTYMTSGKITLNIGYGNLTIKNVSVLDAAAADDGYIVLEQASTVRSFFSYFVDSTSDAVSTVSNAIASIFGQRYEDRNLTVAERKQLRADKKAARQAEIAAAKEAKRQRKLLAKQLKESARQVSVSAVPAEYIEEKRTVMEKGSVSALAESSASMNPQVIGMDQPEQNVPVQVQVARRNSSRDAIVVALILASAMISSGAGYFLFRRKKNIGHL
ncbi:Ig-like domain-containing protein [Treponema sp.]|uniref:Ig-like domain-containing protein n=1 Tax=Treponema sp. TaxID=166 RepID=UPI00388EC741